MAAKKARRKARKTTRRKARKTASSRRPVIVYNFARPKARKASTKRRRTTAKKRTTRLRINGTINGTMNTKGMLNAAKGGALVYVGKTAARVVASKVPATINPNLKAAGLIVIGALAHKVQPDAMKGVIAEGIGMIADPMLAQAGIVNGTINGTLAPDVIEAIEDAAVNGAHSMSDY